MSIRFLCILFSFLLACSDSQDGPVQQAPEKRTIAYLALGDSYTIGTGLAQGDLNYPTQIMNRLQSEESVDSATLDIIAVNGWTTTNLLDGISDGEPDSTYQLVSLLIGVNNQFQGRPISVYIQEFDSLLNQAIAFAGNDPSRVIVLSIPDYGVTPFGASNAATIAKEIDLYNALNDSISRAYNVDNYNITEISRLAVNQPNLLAPDSLHPSGAMYTLWVDSIYDEIRLKLDL